MISFAAFMFLEDVMSFCQRFAAVEETFPFDETTMVWKVMGKMFLLGDIDHFYSITLKCDPERAIQLREEFSQIKPGYHMNNKHWITIELEGMDKSLIFQLISQSYELVIKKLPKKTQEQLKEITI